MTPNIPTTALPVLGPDVSPDGLWGGVPWKDGVPHPEPLEGMLNGNVTIFPYAQSRAVLGVTDSDNDLDGPGLGKGVDPCGQSQTSLRYLDGSSCDSRQFPGVVISPCLEKLGIRLGDFCVVVWKGAVRSAQVYDIGPTRKAGENSLFLNRGLGIIPAAKSDHWAACVGHDAQDVCTLIFADSGPGHAVSVDQIIANAHRLWAAFTSRPAPADAAVATLSGGKTAAVASGGTAAAALPAVPLALAAAILGLPLAVEAAVTPEVIVVLAGLVGLAVIAKVVTGILVDAKKLREKPAELQTLPSPLVVREADQFATQQQLTKIEKDLRNQMVELRNYVHDAVHEIRGLANTMTTAMHEQSEATHELFTKLDAKNEERVQRIGNRVDEVIDRTPSKIIELLRNTGALKS